MVARMVGLLDVSMAALLGTSMVEMTVEQWDYVTVGQ